jgi:Domain of unknown function (DUF4347)
MLHQNVQPNPVEILIADATISDLHVLLNGINPNIKVTLIDENTNGISKIIKAIAEPGLKTLHILAHGAPGQISLGGKIITATDFRKQFDGVAERDVDIAFWSCHTGAGDAGTSFIKAVAETTGARVVATNNLVGNSDKGGSWTLKGIAAPFSSNAQQEFTGVLASVTNTAANLANGIGWKAGDTLTIKNAAGDNKASIDQLNAIRLGTNTTGAPASLASATVTDLSVNANDLNLLDAITKSTIVATSVTWLTGTAVDIAKALTATGISKAANVGVTIAAGSAAATDLNTIDTKTTAVVDATAVIEITGTAAAIATTIKSAGIKTSGTVDITISAGSVAATDLNTIDTKTSTVVDATAVTKITGTATAIATALNSTGISTSGTEDITVSAGSVAATDLNTIDANTSAVVDATAVTTITGTAAAIATALNSTGISTSGTENITVSAGSVAATDLITIDANTTAVVNATAVTAITGTATDIATAISSVGITKSANVGVTIDVGSAAATDLNTIDSKTTVKIVATAVTEITGTATDIATAISSVGITKSANVGVTIDVGSATATDLNSIDSKTSAVVDATAVTAITGTAVAIATTLNSAGINTSGTEDITVSAGSVAATDLNTIDSKTSAVVDATAVTAITGTAAAIATTIKSADIKTSGTQAITVSAGSVAATDLNIIDAKTSGLVNATAVTKITGTAAAIASALNATGISTSGTVDITVSAGSVAATDLNTIDAKTSGLVNATAVTKITGTAAAIASVLNATGISTSGTEAVIVSAGSVTATDLNTIDANTTAVVNATAVNQVTGTAAAIATAVNSTGITKAVNITTTVSEGSASAVDLNAIDAKTTTAVGATAVTTITGTSADIAKALTSTGITKSASIGVTIDAGSAAATDLSKIDGKTSALVDANAVTVITGSAAQVKALYTSAGVSLSAAVDVTFSGHVSVADLNSIDSHTTGVITATVTEHDISTLKTLTGTDNAYAITVTSSTGDVSVADLNSINSHTTGVITATVTEHDISTLNTLIGTDNAYAITVTDSTANAADLNTLDAKTTVNLIATDVSTLTGSATDIATAISATTINKSANVGVIIGDTTVSADTLLIIAANTSAIIDATGVNEITGSISNIETATSSSQIAYATDYAVTVSDTVTVDDLNTLSSKVTGVISAHVSDNDIATLLTFTPANPGVPNNLYFTITNDTVSAADLLTLVSETAVNIDTTAVSTFTGSAADLASVVASGVVDYIVSLSATIDAGSANATDLNTIDSYLFVGNVDATAVTEVTGTVTEIETAIGSSGITFAADYAITVSDSTYVTVADLNLFAATTSGVITAHVSDNDIATLLTFTPANPGVPNNLYFTVTNDTVSAADLLTLVSETNVNIDATAVSTFTGSAADLASVIASGVVDYIAFLNATVDAGSADATDLNTIDSYLFVGNVDATAVTEVTGTITDIETAIGSSGITFASDVAITVSDSTYVTVADLNLFAATTSGVLTAYVSDNDISTLLTFTPANPGEANKLYFTITNDTVSAADLLTLVSETTVNIDATAVSTFTGSAADIASVVASGVVDYIVFLNATVDAGSANAADLITIDDNLFLGNVDATALTEVTGSLANVETAITSEGISLSTNYAVTIYDYASVADLNTITTATTGVITALVSNGDVASLLTLTGTDENYYISITDDSVNAANLLTLSTITTIAINATNSHTFTGSAADLATVLTSDTINHLTVGVTSIVDAGTAQATDLFTIDDNSILTVDATAVTTISGTLADIQTDVSSDGISFSSNYNVNVTDTGNLGTLNAFTTSGSLILGNSSNNDITVNLGTSGFSSITLNGSGHDVITTSANVTETFILGAAQNGGTTLNNLTIGDKIDIDGANAIAGLRGGNLGTAGNVLRVGQWAFNDVSDQLTYFNSVDHHAESITLTGVNHVTLENGDVFIIA